MGMSPKQPPMKSKAIRIPDPLWEAALAVAAERGETLSDAIRDMLTDYVAKKA